MDKPKQPSADSNDNSLQHDQAKEELAELSTKLAKIRHTMSEYIFSFSPGPAIPADREHELNILADELERISIRVDDFTSNDLIETKLQAAICKELDFASDTLHDLSEATGGHLDQDVFVDCIECNTPSIEEAEIMLNLLRAAYGAYAIGLDTYLTSGARCGYAPKKIFTLTALIPKIERAVVTLNECVIGDGFNTFDPAKKGDIMFIGEKIKETLATIIKTLDQTKGDVIERAMRLVTVKLEAVLAIMREELELSKNLFYSPVIANVLHLEINGGFCLERIRQDKLTDDVLPLEELEDAVAIMKMVQQIAQQ